MNKHLDPISGETRVTFGLREWLGIIGVLVAVTASHWTTKGNVANNRRDIDRVVKKLDNLADNLTGMVRLDERLRGLERRVEGLEARE